MQMSSVITIQLPTGGSITVPLHAIGATSNNVQANQTAIVDFTSKVLESSATSKGKGLTSGVKLTPRVQAETSVQTAGSNERHVVALGVTNVDGDIMFVGTLNSDETIASFQERFRKQTFIEPRKYKLMRWTVSGEKTEMKGEYTQMESGLVDGDVLTMIATGEK